MSAGRSAHEKRSFFRVFSRLNLFTQVLGQVKEHLKLKFQEIIRAVAWPIAFFFLWTRLARRSVSVQSYENWSFFCVFSRFCPFLQVFGQINDWSILEVHEVIRVLHMVACANDFFFYSRDWPGKMFKVMKNDNFLNVFISFGLFFQVFG